MIKYIEITLYNDDNINVEAVTDELRKLGLRHKRVRRLKEGDLKENLPPVPQQNKDKKCCGRDKDEKPLGIVDTGKSLIKSAGEYISKGMKHVTNEEYLRRLNICQRCEWIKDGFQCGQCHCFMNVKAGWDIENGCKLNKW